MVMRKYKYVGIELITKNACINQNTYMNLIRRHHNNNIILCIGKHNEISYYQ